VVRSLSSKCLIAATVFISLTLLAGCPVRKGQKPQQDEEKKAATKPKKGTPSSTKKTEGSKAAGSDKAKPASGEGSAGDSASAEGDKKSAESSTGTPDDAAPIEAWKLTSASLAKKHIGKKVPGQPKTRIWHR
jgi:hypothetical protein